MITLFIILLLSSATIVNREIKMITRHQQVVLETTTHCLICLAEETEIELEEMDNHDSEYAALLLSQLADYREEILNRENDPELDLEVSAPVELTVQEKYLALFDGR